MNRYIAQWVNVSYPFKGLKSVTSLNAGLQFLRNLRSGEPVGVWDTSTEKLHMLNGKAMRSAGGTLDAILGRL